MLKIAKLGDPCCLDLDRSLHILFSGFNNDIVNKHNKAPVDSYFIAIKKNCYGAGSKEFALIYRVSLTWRLPQLYCTGIQMTVSKHHGKK